MDKSNTIRLIQGLIHEIEGPDTRKDLIATPERVYRALEEMLNGYEYQGALIKELFTTFDDDDCIPDDGEIDQIVALKNIRTVSFCEHHLLPFHISANVAYLPRDKVIGASKLARIVNAYAHRLQIQERITRQVANTLVEYLNPYGVAVIIKGDHSCIRDRGIKSVDSEFMTSVMLGVFRDSVDARLEVLSLLGF